MTGDGKSAFELSYKKYRFAFFSSRGQGLEIRVMQPSEENDLALIGRYLGADFTDDQLYELLSDSAGLGADEINRSAEGKARFSVFWARQKRNICALPAVRQYVSNPNISDSTMIAAQIANHLVNVPGVNVMVIACLALRIGLRALCSGEPS